MGTYQELKQCHHGKDTGFNLNRVCVTMEYLLLEASLVLCYITKLQIMLFFHRSITLKQMS